MRHIIALVALVLSIAAFVFMYNLDVALNKYQKIQEVIAKSKQEVKIKNNIQAIKQTKKEEESEEEKKIKMLKEKAGNLGAFEVSPLYKRKCSSCHGVNGEGIIGPKLVGLSKDYILKSLKDFKSGKRKNYVMFGLLNNMKESELESLANEISTFKQKLQNAK